MQLLCIGDVALAQEDLSKRVWHPPAEVTPGDGARVLFNWELPIGTTVNPFPRSSGPRLLGDPGSAEVIRRWAPGFATLATNHILDAGDKGLVKTIELLNRAGFKTVGAGRTPEEIRAPLFWETAQGRLAIVNWVFPETHPDWMAIPGPNCWPGLENAKPTVQDAKRDADWVLIVVHWSDELFPYPRPEDRTMARELVELGADMVIGHHPHVVRGMEIIGSCPVFYSIGNFYFSDVVEEKGRWIVKHAPRNREGLGIRISFKRGVRPQYEPLSFIQRKGQVVLDPSCRAIRRLKRVSRPMQRLRDAEYDGWYKVQLGYFDRWTGRWHFGVRRLGFLGSIRRLIRGRR